MKRLVAVLGVIALLFIGAHFIGQWKNDREDAAEALAKVAALEAKIQVSTVVLTNAINQHEVISDSLAVEKQSRLQWERRYETMRPRISEVLPPVLTVYDTVWLTAIAQRDTALRLADSTVAGLKRENALLAQDTVNLMGAVRLAQRELMDTTNALADARRSLARAATRTTVRVSGLRRLLPKVYVGKEVMSYDLATQRFEVGSSRVSLDVGWEISF